MKSLQLCLLSALLVISSSSPIPEEVVAPTADPAVPVTPEVAPAVKSPEPVVPGAQAVPEVTATQKALENEKIPEPQALPSKAEDAATPKTEEKKREAEPATEKTEPKPEEKKAEAPTKSLPVTENVAVQPTKEAVAPVVEPQPVETVKSVAVDATQQPAEPVSTVVVPEAKKADIKQAIESTDVPAVPAGIASEKKIDAEAPAPIVSENVQQQVQPEQKSALPVPAGQIQAQPEAVQGQESKAVADVKAAAEGVAPAAPAASDSSSASSEKKVDESDSSSSSSEESKESKESQEEEKKTA